MPPLSWLIPAWAGKTGDDDFADAGGAAHPRVGGENRIVVIAESFVAWLIPAWAGKTRAARPHPSHKTAHPRVGGENSEAWATPATSAGSSPRGRGKQNFWSTILQPLRLIPAWAGKTSAAATMIAFCRAHPRVGGENRTVTLLPGVAAHPRVGGENRPASISPSMRAGSSPRGRGKHFLTCAFIKRIGQILETLELAVSSGSYSLCDVYATDAQQDQARNTGLALPSSRAAS